MTYLRSACWAHRASSNSAACWPYPTHRTRSARHESTSFLSHFPDRPGNCREPPVSIAFDQWLDAQMLVRRHPTRKSPPHPYPRQTVPGWSHSPLRSTRSTAWLPGRLIWTHACKPNAGRRSCGRQIYRQLQPFRPCSTSMPSVPPQRTASPIPAFTEYIPESGFRPNLANTERRDGGKSSSSSLVSARVEFDGNATWRSGDGPGGRPGSTGLARGAGCSRNAHRAERAAGTAEECTIQPLTVDEVMARLPLCPAHVGVTETPHIITPVLDLSKPLPTNAPLPTQPSATPTSGFTVEGAFAGNRDDPA